MKPRQRYRSLAAFVSSVYPRLLTALAKKTDEDGRERAATLFLGEDGTYTPVGAKVGWAGRVRSPDVPSDTVFTIDIHTHAAEHGLMLSERDWRNVIQKYLRGAPYGGSEDYYRGVAVCSPSSDLDANRPAIRSVETTEEYVNLDPVLRRRVQGEAKEWLRQNGPGETPDPLEDYVSVSDRVVPAFEWDGDGSAQQ